MRKIFRYALSSIEITTVGIVPMAKAAMVREPTQAGSVLFAIRT